jgi:hypothetical protein
LRCTPEAEANVKTVTRRLLPMSAVTGLVLVLSPDPARAQQQLCDRPSEQPQALFDRLTKSENLKEDFRDKSYVAISDKAAGTVWTFTVPGHPAHPSVVCRRPVQDGAEMRLQTDVRCNASEAECQKLVKAFQELNQRMMQEMRRQQKK